MTRFTHQHLIELVGGDRELIERLVEEGVIEQGPSDVAIVDVDQVLLAQTLVRELAIDWSGVDIILRLMDELTRARQRIAELERTFPSTTER